MNPLNLTGLQEKLKDILTIQADKSRMENSIGQMTWFLPQIHGMKSKKSDRKRRRYRKRIRYISQVPYYLDSI